ncbi:relaxase/mobilization nuclease domain-containing protein [Donghicola tyrosinivorans]|uniref:Relaxase/mobilization nuclease-like protein n=1 Tax=Donghicola tyrosinivorans TaxID=1652492 RepID=A0A2T0WYF2_9RHOB|nr:relaxase/mobilization nuclease domain-containing protein [Donghicola tyrosinivorans]PRY91733.1 relaxase/mobilization nuclease-like protein [Donghicola tyrosinivorans]
MAIGKLIKGANPNGLVDYLLGATDNQGRDRPKVAIVGGTLGFDGVSAKRQFATLRKLRPSVTKNIVHMSISLPAQDRELSEDEWSAIGDHWAKEMGFQAYLTVCHGDHIHIAASRIRLDGSVVSDSHDYRRSEALVREVEQMFELIPVEPSHLLNADRKADHITAPKSGELEMAAKGEISSKAQLQKLLSDLTAKPITASDFVDALEACGVDVRPNVSPTTGRLSGFAFGLDGNVLSASALGRGFSLKNLEKRGFAYVKDRDFQKLSEAKERSLERAFSDAAGDERGGAARSASGDTCAAPRDWQSIGADNEFAGGAKSAECASAGPDAKAGSPDAGFGEATGETVSQLISQIPQRRTGKPDSIGHSSDDEPQPIGLAEFLNGFERRVQVVTRPLWVLQQILAGLENVRQKLRAGKAISKSFLKSRSSVGATPSAEPDHPQDCSDRVRKGVSGASDDPEPPIPL